MLSQNGQNAEHNGHSTTQTDMLQSVRNGVGDEFEVRRFALNEAAQSHDRVDFALLDDRSSGERKLKSARNLKETQIRLRNTEAIKFTDAAELQSADDRGIPFSRKNRHAKGRN